MNRWFVRTIFAVFIVVNFSAIASAISPTIVISQIYTGVTNVSTESPLGRHDYIELFNRGNAAVNVDGWTIQIAAQNETAWLIVRLSGTIGPGQYWLVRGALNQSGVAALPAADVTTDFRLDPVGGRVALIENSNPLQGACPTGSALDFVAFGSNPCPGNAGALTQVTTIARMGGGCVDTDSSDFHILTPFPRNASTPRNLCGATASPKAFTFSSNGGQSLQTKGAAGSLSIGYVRVQPSGTNPTPTGLAVFSQRQGSTLISEATVPAANLIRSGFLYVDVNGPVNTGVAIANPNNQDALISYSFFDTGRGIFTRFGSMTVPANGQIARFVNELPYALLTPVQGTLAFTSDVPVGVIALRGRTNERGEFLITTTPVVDGAVAPSTNESYLAHYAVGGGWRTEAILINTSQQTITGSLEFRNAAGNPVSLRIGTESGTSFPYSLLGGASQKFILNSVSGDLVTGSIRVAPASGSAVPVALAVFSFTRESVTVSEAGLVSLRGNRFRTYVEFSGTPGSNGSVLPGIAIANTSSQTATVDLELFRLDGMTTGLKASVSIGASAQSAKFLNELFPTLSAPFQGILRASSTTSISVIGLRARYNERGDFLFTTVPFADEDKPLTTGESVFPHFADSGGYSTQFILFGGSGQASTGTLLPLTPGGQPLALELQ